MLERLDQAVEVEEEAYMAVSWLYPVQKGEEGEESSRS